MRLNDKGVVLVFVLWVLVFLSVIVTSFSYLAGQNRKTVFFEGIQTKAYFIAQAGVHTALTQFIQSQKENTTTQWRLNTTIPSQEFGEGEFQVFISNEGGKINLNQADSFLLKILLNKMDLRANDKDIIIDSILDWRDKDNLYRLNGAEDAYYSALPEPYTCRDGHFLTLTELLKVRGVTPLIYNTCFKDTLTIKKDENEMLPLRSSMQTYLQLENRGSSNSNQTFLTLEKRKLNNRIGDIYDYSKISINAASPKMLMALPGMTEHLLKKILEYRKTKDFIALSELKKIVGTKVYQGFQNFISLSLSRYYTITSVARVKGSDILSRVKMDVWIDNAGYDGYQILQRY